MEQEVANKKGRLIVRNLVFNLNETHIRKLFEPYGEIVEVNMPINNVNNKNKGFAFVQYKTRKEAVNAISKLNGTTYKGRTIAVDISVPKVVYKEIEKGNKKPEEKEEEPMEEVEPIAKPEIVQPVEPEEKKEEKLPVEEVKKVKKNKLNEKTTLFVRNIGFDTTEDDFYDYFSSYGELNYAKLCMNKETKIHKGTGFVQYKSEENAKSMLELSKRLEAYYDTKREKKDKRKEESKLSNLKKI